MRKIYSLVLIAAGLLIGTSMWAGPAKVALTREANPDMPQVEKQQMAEPQPFAMVAAQQSSMRKAPKRATQNEDAQAKVYLKNSPEEASAMSVAEAFNYVNTTPLFGKYDTVVVELQGDVTFANITGSYGFTLNANKTMLLELNGNNMIASINQSGTTALINNKGRMIINDKSANEKGVGNGKISFYSATVDEQETPAYASNTIRNEGTLVVKSALIENLCKGGGATYCIDHMQDTLIIDNGKLYSYCDCVRQWVSSETRVNYFVLNGGVLESSGRPMWTQLPNSDATKKPKAETYFYGGELIAGDGNSYAYNTYSYGNQMGGVKININGTKFNKMLSIGGNSSICDSGDALTVNILGGTYDNQFMFPYNDVTLNIYDGEFNNDIYTYGGFSNGGDNEVFNIYGGTFNADVYTYYSVAAKTTKGNQINITNGTFNGCVISYKSNNTHINISGGTFNNEVYLYTNNSDNPYNSYNSSINISDGTFKEHVYDFAGNNNSIEVTGGLFAKDLLLQYPSYFATEKVSPTIVVKGGYYQYDSYYDYNGGTYFCQEHLRSSYNPYPTTWRTSIQSSLTREEQYDEEMNEYTPYVTEGGINYYFKVGLENKTRADINEEGKIVVSDGEGGTREPESTDNIIIINDNPEGDDEYGRYTLYLDQLNVNGITFAGRDTIDVIAKPGSIVNVGSSGIKASDTTTVYMTVEGGGAMKVGVEAIQKVDTIIVKSDANGNGTLLISPNAQLTDAEKSATVKLYVDGACKIDDAHYVWQHIAVPTDGTGTFTVENDRKATDPDFRTHVQWWNQALTTSDKWHQINSWEEMNKPWQGFILTTNSTTPGVTYSFTGNIIGNNDGQLHFDATGYNFFGNSYTAPINVQTMLNGISNGEDIEMTVWIYSADKLRYLESNNLMRLLGMAEFDQISSMQGFWLRNMTDSYGKNTSVNYTNAVWNNPGAMGNPKVHAPARRKMATDMGLTTAQIIVSAEGREDKLALVEGSDYTEGFDNGSDASKMLDENSFNIYASTGIGNLACVATDNIAGTILSFKAAKAGEYTMSFANLNGEKYAIYDMQTGITTNMSEGGSLTFTANAGVNEGRFMVVPAKQISTGNETVKAASNVKGIYTLLGQFVAPTREWSHLPAGVYVVDGHKVVK